MTTNSDDTFVTEMIQEVDSDNDGEISQKEFKAMMGKMILKGM